VKEMIGNRRFLWAFLVFVLSSQNGLRIIKEAFRLDFAWWWFGLQDIFLWLFILLELPSWL
jgi:hypothetical protein